MLDWLRKPYPFLYENLLIRIRVALFITVFVFLFLIIFKPFQIDRVLVTNLYMGAFFYGLTSGIVVFLVGGFLIRFLPGFFSDKDWTIGKELISTNIMLISVGIANAFVGTYLECRPLTNGTVNFWWEIYQDFIHTYAVGIFPVMVLTAISYSIFLKRNLAKAIENNKNLNLRLEEQPVSKVAEDQLVTIVSPANNNDFSFRLNDLLFIMADGNYVEFHMESEDAVKREIRRNTLSHIESQLAEYDFLFRSHRAYLVNLKKVVHSSGNAQGYELKLAKTTHTVPVSRRNLGRFDELIKR
ncbi:MAG: LytTR family transcriptional regulator [Bacteroidetes bacterium]|nr:LytTR family transcriptional regulator [Bacteroidota bacterium]